MAARSLVALAAVLMLCAGESSAQQLQRLHVRGIALSADTAHPKTGVPFDVTLTIRIAERSALQNVFLPSFSGAQELGDFRVQTTGPRGTDYRETLTLVAQSPGVVRIGPGYLDAIDARDGKPKRFISNGMQVVAGVANIAGANPADVVLWTALALVVLFVSYAVALAVSRRGAKAPAVSAVPPAAPVAPPSLAETLAQLQRRRDRRSVMQVRSALWRLAGAHEGQTLAQVLQLPPARDDDLRALLVAVERAVFVRGEQLDPAIENVLDMGAGVPA